MDNLVRPLVLQVILHRERLQGGRLRETGILFPNDASRGTEARGKTTEYQPSDDHVDQAVLLHRNHLVRFLPSYRRYATGANLGAECPTRYSGVVDASGTTSCVAVSTPDPRSAPKSVDPAGQSSYASGGGPSQYHGDGASSHQ